MALESGFNRSSGSCFWCCGSRVSFCCNDADQSSDLLSVNLIGRLLWWNTYIWSRRSWFSFLCILRRCDRPEQVYSTIYCCVYEKNLLRRETKEIPSLRPFWRSFLPRRSPWTISTIRAAQPGYHRKRVLTVTSTYAVPWCSPWTLGISIVAQAPGLRWREWYKRRLRPATKSYTGSTRHTKDF